MSWIYKDKVINNIDQIAEDAIGFVYKITHLPTGQYYIGKKSLKSIRNIKIGKRELEKIREERKSKGIGGRLPKKKRVVKESDWLSYFSSNEWIKEQIKKGNQKDFKREILSFHTSKKSLTYSEVEEQIKRDILRDDNSLNSNILGSFYKKDLI